MGSLLFLILLVASIPVFMWAYRRRLDALEGPWIARAKARGKTGDSKA
jgi:hypothetical protein